MQVLTEVREFDSVLDKENGDVVANNIPIAFIRIELCCKSTDITNRIRASFASLHGGKPHEYRCVPRRVRQDSGIRQVLQAFLKFEVAKRACTACMHHSLRDTLMVKTMNLTKH